MDCRTRGFPVLHHLPELAQAHGLVHTCAYILELLSHMWHQFWVWGEDLPCLPKEYISPILPANGSFISQAIFGSSAPTCSQYLSLQEVSFIYCNPQTRGAGMWRVWGVGEGRLRKEWGGQSPRRVPDWTLIQSQVWVPPPQGYRCQKPESISRLYFPFSCSWWLLFFFFLNKSVWVGSKASQNCLFIAVDFQCCIN